MLVRRLPVLATLVLLPAAPARPLDVSSPVEAVDLPAGSAASSSGSSDPVQRVAIGLLALSASSVRAAPTVCT